MSLIVRLVCWLGIHWKDPLWVGCEKGQRIVRCKACEVAWHEREK